MKPNPPPIEFDPSRETRGMTRAFGGFVLLVALVPSTIVAAQWLSFDGRGPEPQTDWISIIPGSLLALWGLAMLTAKARVRADPATQTLTWSKRTLGVWRVTHRWSWSEVQFFIAHPNDRDDSHRGYTSLARGPRGERVVLEYSRHTAAEVKQLSELLGVPYNVE